MSAHDHQAWDTSLLELCDQGYGALVGSVRLATGDVSAAEDIVQRP